MLETRVEADLLDHADTDVAVAQLGLVGGDAGGVLEGDLDPTAAFMQGKLAVDGDMGLAMKLAAVLG